MVSARAVTIAAGRDAFEDPFVNGFFFAGGLALVVTFVLAGAGVAPRHRGVWGELNLWLIALLTLALVLVLRSRAQPV